MEFNVNDYVYVKLTETGLRELERQHEELRKTFPKMGRFVSPEADSEGWTRWQMHNLMYELGHLMVLGTNPPFETTIKIEDEAIA